ncbi:MAG: DUF4827 family protein [Fermentimonas sp.]|jgi:hypothetical protein
MRISRATTILITALLMLFTACNDKKTYADYLKDEARAIDLFIKKNGLEILDKLPPNGQFKSNQFYKDASTGVYYNIVEYGNKQQKASLGDEVYIRFKGLTYFMTDDTTKYNNLDPIRSPFPQTLVYRGKVNSNTKSHYSTAGWMVPVPDIGHKAVVKLIVPFEMGSSYDQSNYQPTYYDHVEYRFEGFY